MSRRTRTNRDMAKLTRILAQNRFERNGTAALKPHYKADTPCAVIFKSEMDYISSCILDRPNIETGGQLFGYWTETGIPVVMYAIGPGRNANHQKTFFNQDVNYLLKVGARLRRLFGLHHIGEWHSHHRLGLAHPSGHDANTMISTIREKRLGKFMLCIGNCDDKGEKSTLNPFFCDSESCSPWGWNIIGAESPVRRAADMDLRDILIHPSSESCHADPRLNSHMEKAIFPKGYWLGEEWGKQEFKDYIGFFKANFPASLESISPKIDSDGLAHIVLTGYGEESWVEEDILFPRSYPRVPPVIKIKINGRLVKTSDTAWDISNGTYCAFMKYYCKSQPDTK